MKKVKLIRTWKDHNQATGCIQVLDANGQPLFMCVAIERGDRDNQPMVGHVPRGMYPLVLEESPKFGKLLWELKEVPGRTECKIHVANFWRQLNGCIALGKRLKDLDKDGYYDVTDSANTLEEFHKAMEGIERTTIEIIDL